MPRLKHWSKYWSNLVNGALSPGASAGPRTLRQWPGPRCPSRAARARSPRPAAGQIIGQILATRNLASAARASRVPTEHWPHSLECCSKGILVKKNTGQKNAGE
jgi:hypothetical protein